MLASIAPVHPRMPPLHCCLFWVWGMRKFAPCACVVAAPRGCVDILSCSLCGGHRKGWTNSTVREQQSNTLLPLFCPPPPLFSVSVSPRLSVWSSAGGCKATVLWEVAESAEGEVTHRETLVQKKALSLFHQKDIKCTLAPPPCCAGCVRCARTSGAWGKLMLAWWWCCCLRSGPGRLFSWWLD